jgi:hypothetical protein
MDWTGPTICGQDVYDGIRLFHLMIETDVLDSEYAVNIGFAPWQIVLKGEKLRCGFSSRLPMNGALRICGNCKPMADLCTLNIQNGNGFNMSRAIRIVTSRKPGYMFSQHGRSLIEGVNEATKTVRAGTSTTNNDCCYLSILAVLLRHGTDIDPLLAREPTNADTITLMNRVLDPSSRIYGYTWRKVFPISPPLEELYKVCETLALYFPRCTPQLLSSILSSVNYTSSENDEMTEKLDRLMKTPKALKFLAKLCLLRSLRRKYVDVDKLPLPDAMKTYLRIHESQS